MSVKLDLLADCGLGIDRASLEKLFADFATPLVPKDDPVWRKEVGRRRRRLLRQYVKKNLLGAPKTGREERHVQEEYGKAWSGIRYSIYSLAAEGLKRTPWELDNRCCLASDVGATRFRQLLLIRVIEQLRPRRVLEVGSGNGINLLLLAGRFPEIAFTGLELTRAGVEAARGLQQDYAELPETMRCYAPEPLVDPTAFRRIEFIQGNAMAMPFEEVSFDLVYSLLALEQMEAIRQAALAEVARVCGGAYFGIEPFREANATFWRHLYIKQRGYFQGSVSDLKAYGLEPAWATMDFPQEALLGACAVLARKTPANSV